MKYKCLKDFWMYNESEENGDVPAFKAGDVYEFFGSDLDTGYAEMYTPKNNKGNCHYSSIKWFDEYFELVEE